MRRVLAGVAATVALAIGCALPAQAAPAEFGGMNAQWVFWGPKTSWDQHLTAMAAGGVKTVRFDATWATVEPAPPILGTHLFLWTTLDDVASAIAQHHMRWQPVLSYSTLWSSSQPGTTIAPPSHPADFAAFARAFAARYGAGGSFWGQHPELDPLPVRAYEIWNEENIPTYWKPAPDPGAYADLYAAARDAIHAVDPGGQVMVGGLANRDDPPKFVEGMLAHRPDLRGHLDAVALHPYANDAAAALAAVVRMRLGLQYLGSGDAPIIASEFGWTTTGQYAVTDAWRAGQVAQLTRDLARSDCNVTGVQLHTWVRLTELQSDAEDGFAVVHSDGTQTQTAVDYLATLRDVVGGGAGAPGSLKACWPQAATPPAPTSPAPSEAPPAAQPAEQPSSPSAPAPPTPNAQGPTPPAPTAAPAPSTRRTCKKATPKRKAKRKTKRRAKRSACTKRKPKRHKHRRKR
jgi:hypothetical protein